MFNMSLPHTRAVGCALTRTDLTPAPTPSERKRAEMHRRKAEQEYAQRPQTARKPGQGLGLLDIIHADDLRPRIAQRRQGWRPLRETEKVRSPVVLAAAFMAHTGRNTRRFAKRDAELNKDVLDSLRPWVKNDWARDPNA